MSRRHPTSTLFPYTTLFRSRARQKQMQRHDQDRREANEEELVGRDSEARAEVDGDLDLAAEILGIGAIAEDHEIAQHQRGDRKSTRLNSSHVEISYAVFCLK